MAVHKSTWYIYIYYKKNNDDNNNNINIYIIKYIIIYNYLYI